MKKEIGKYLAILLGCICIILTIILIYIKSSTVSAQTDTKNLKSKIEEELSYLDSNIIKVMNKLNNITVINYKVYTREINEPSNSQQSNSSQESSQGGSSGSSQSSSGNESNSGQGGNSRRNGRHVTRFLTARRVLRVFRRFSVAQALQVALVSK